MELLDRVANTTLAVALALACEQASSPEPERTPGCLRAQWASVKMLLHEPV